MALVKKEREVLADFGLVPKRRRLTVAENTTQVAKAKDTRNARKTLGPREKAKIKGVVAEATPTTIPPTTPPKP
jgi:hypothetical protein